MSAKDKRIPVVMVGTGNVGNALLNQLATMPQLRVIAVCTLEGTIIDTDGFKTREMSHAFYSRDIKKLPGKILNAYAEDLADQLVAAYGNRPVIVADVTAADIGEQHLAWLRLGYRVATANKKPVTGSQQLWNDLMEYGPHRYRFECTCGAGLPIISTMQDLLATGDRIERVRAAASGSLGYIMSCCDQANLTTSQLGSIILQARLHGYTEPDPRDDLSCMDLARKALVLARLSGHKMELEEIGVETLVPAELRRLSLEDFLARMNEGRNLDELLEKILATHRQNKKMRCLIDVRGRLARVGARALAEDDSFARLQGADNLFAIETNRYSSLPLSVGGPGAGPGVTAAGVLSDMLRLADKM